MSFCRSSWRFSHVSLLAFLTNENAPSVSMFDEKVGMLNIYFFTYIKFVFVGKVQMLNLLTRTGGVISADYPFNLEESTCIQILQST